MSKLSVCQSPENFPNPCPLHLFASGENSRFAHADGQPSELLPLRVLHSCGCYLGFLDCSYESRDLRRSNLTFYASLLLRSLTQTGHVGCGYDCTPG